ncbi:MAG: hypothetical protein H7146_02400 [Burkholderiaceae bacterium]|nr:hypothetical protein [Microbacteriaceae bacterium]
MIMRPAALLVFALTLLAFAAAPTLVDGASSASADDGSIDITVTVSPAPVAPGTTDGRGTAVRGSGGSGSSGSSTVVTGPDTIPAGAELPAHGFDLGGILYLSGLTTTTMMSPNPFDGTVHGYFTVRNVSGTTLTSSARFWLDGPFGNQLSEVTGIDIVDLKPDESRVIDATLAGVGQWTFMTAHATLTPPDVVEGTTLSPITRDSVVVVAPWLVGAGAGLGAAALGGMSLIRRTTGAPRLVRATS